MSAPTLEQVAAIGRAYDLGSQSITFYAKAVGRRIDYEFLAKERALLDEWEAACLAGIRAARAAGDPTGMRMLAQQLAECRVFLAINAEDEPR